MSRQTQPESSFAPRPVALTLDVEQARVMYEMLCVETAERELTRRLIDDPENDYAFELEQSRTLIAPVLDWLEQAILAREEEEAAREAARQRFDAEIAERKMPEADARSQEAAPALK